MCRMSVVGDSPEIELVRRSFEALIQGEYGVLESSLAKNARWRTVEEGQANCEGRKTIIGIMRRNLGGRLRGTIEEATLAGSSVVVGFRPERPADAGDPPLERGIAYMVVRIEGRKITELKGCADRAAAVVYAEMERSDRPPGAAPAAPGQAYPLTNRGARSAPIRSAWQACRRVRGCGVSSFPVDLEEGTRCRT
jgi:hypothetical protein